MQDAGVIGVLGVLGVELPVIRQYLRAAAEYPRRTVQHAANPTDDLRPEIVFEIGRVAAERPEDEAGELGHPQWCEVVVVLAEFRRHPALPLDAALKGDASQLAGQIVGP